MSASHYYHVYTIYKVAHSAQLLLPHLNNGFLYVTSVGKGQKSYHDHIWRHQKLTNTLTHTHTYVHKVYSNLKLKYHPWVVRNAQICILAFNFINDL